MWTLFPIFRHKRDSVFIFIFWSALEPILSYTLLKCVKALSHITWEILKMSVCLRCSSHQQPHMKSSSFFENICFLSGYSATSDSPEWLFKGKMSGVLVMVDYCSVTTLLKQWREFRQDFSFAENWQRKTRKTWLKTVNYHYYIIIFELFFGATSGTSHL